MATESTRPLLVPQNRKLRHVRGLSLRNLTFTRPRGRTIDDAALNKSPAKMEALRLSHEHQLQHALSDDDLRPHAARRRSTHLANASTSPLSRQKAIEAALDARLADAFFSLHIHDDNDTDDEPVYISEVQERATVQHLHLLGVR